MDITMISFSDTGTANSPMVLPKFTIKENV